MIDTLSPQNFQAYCDELARRDRHLAGIVQEHGYPPLWNRPAGFASLIHIVLEQQVSLASAKAAFVKLGERLGEITPEKLLLLTDEEMKACYFSRQKMGYARNIALAIVEKRLQLHQLDEFPDDVVSARLQEVKGIGKWTAEIYLLFVLQRTDIFPLGDLAMINALKELKQLPPKSPAELMLAEVDHWRPYRSVGTMLLWHYYIQKRGIRL